MTTIDICKYKENKQKRLQDELNQLRRENDPQAFDFLHTVLYGLEDEGNVSHRLRMKIEIDRFIAQSDRNAREKQIMIELRKIS